MLSAEEISSLLEAQKTIALIPCSCREGRASCSHPLHKPHEGYAFMSLGLAAVFQIGSGLGRRIDGKEAERLFQRASDSGLVQHALYSFGKVAEICNCCPETCAVIKAYERGIPEAVRPSEYMAARGPECDGCPERPGRICKEVCPYGTEPSRAECLGCGLCAGYCPQHAVRMGLRGG